MIAIALVIMASLLGAAFKPAAAADESALTILSVVKGENVTIRLSGMPANKEFRVLMGKIGTQAVDGTNVGTGKTGSDGSFSKTFPIPASLARESKIAIRAEATDKTGWYAYNWFTNSTSGSSSGSTSSSGSSSGSSGSVSTVGNVSSTGNLSIVDVEEDTAVDIQAKNLPANQTFKVWFDWKTNNGAVKGVQSGTVKSDKNGAVVASVKMPAALTDRHDLRIRLQSTNGTNAAASAWFLNADSDEDSGGSVPSGSDQSIPYLSTGSVVENDSVTVTAHNFPNKTELDVYMGKYGTQAEDGIYVDTVKSPKSGKSFSFTVDIPKDLKNKEKIAIRIEVADDSDFYAYDWFYNETTSSSQ
jgi:hypothetical protein